MKTLKRILFVFAVAVLFMQCDNPPPIQPDSNINEKFELESEVTNARIEINPRSVVQFTGKAVCTLSNSILYELHGEISLIDANGSFSVNNGLIKINCLLSGSNLFGEFEGIGFIKDGAFRLEGEINIIDGTDKFSDRSGSLKLLIEGEFLQEKEEMMNYTLSIEGYLGCPG